MNWLKVAAVAIGALIAFLVVGSVIHLIMTVLGYILVAALVAGGGYVVYKIATNRRGREVRGRRRGREIRNDHHDDLRDTPPDTGYAAPPPPRPAAGNVDDDLARLKREMGHLQPTYRFQAWRSLMAALGPSKRTWDAVIRPIDHSVSSAGVPVTVTTCGDPFARIL